MVKKIFFNKFLLKFIIVFIFLFLIKNTACAQVIPGARITTLPNGTAAYDVGLGDGQHFDVIVTDSTITTTGYLSDLDDGHTHASWTNTTVNPTNDPAWTLASSQAVTDAVEGQGWGTDDTHIRDTWTNTETGETMTTVRDVEQQEEVTFSGPSMRTSYYCAPTHSGGPNVCRQTQSYNPVSRENCQKKCYPAIGGIVYIDEDLDGVRDSGERGYPGNPTGTYQSNYDLLSFISCSEDSCDYGEQCVSDSFCTFLGFPTEILDNDGNIKSCSRCGFLQSCREKSICLFPNYEGLRVTIQNLSTLKEYIVTTFAAEPSASTSLFGSYHTYDASIEELLGTNNPMANYKGIPSGIYRVTLEVPEGYYTTTPNPLYVAIDTNPINYVNFGITTTPITVTPPIAPSITPPVPSYSVTGTVFLDDNGNGQKEEYEPCYNGPVNITVGDTTITFNSTSECNKYLISDLNQCTALVHIEVPSGYESTGWYGINLTGETISGVNTLATDNVCQ